MTDALSAPVDLVPAPGARGAKHCGIWSLILSCTCVGLPIGLVLAICALVLSAKARRLARENPGTYERPTATGLVTGIIGLAMPVVMLPFLGIVSAIAIPALLGQRGRARDKAAVANTVEGVGDLLNQFDRLREAQTPLPEIPARLESQLRSEHGIAKNPWNMAAPAYSFHIKVVSGLDREGVEQAACAEAGTLGQSVYVIELPSDQQPGYLAGAVRTQLAIGGTNVQTKVAALE
jgi:hypothetical protein